MRKLGLATAVVFVGLPVGPLFLQWVLVLRAVLFPETTCWIAEVDDNFLFSSELPAAYMLAGATFWLPAAFIAASLALFDLGRGSGRWFAIVTPILAFVALSFLYFGTDIAANLEREAYAEVRESC